MEQSALLSKLRAYGADIDGIAYRFAGDTALYAACLSAFLNSRDFPALEEAMQCADSKRAFAAAHNLKGVSGNLGLTPFYQAVCQLVEPLRRGGGESLSAEYAEMKNQYLRLKAMAGDGHG